MPLAQGIVRQIKRFTKGVDYSSGEIGDALIDAQNLLLIQNKLQTRPGRKKFSSVSTNATINSLSYYVNSDGTVKELLSKSSTILSGYDEIGQKTDVKTGLTSGIRHSALTMNGRHIVALGADGAFSYDGTNFVALGIPVPGAPTVAVSSGGSLLDATIYEVRTSFEGSGIGTEGNAGTVSAQVTTADPNLQIDVTNIATTTNPLIDKVNIYLRDVTNAGSFLFVAQINEGTTTFTIDEIPTSTQTIREDASAPLGGGAKFLAIFNRRLVLLGNGTFQNEVFFSNIDEPDTFDFAISPRTAITSAEGPVTGGTIGYYRGDNLSQYLVVFKRRSTHVYSEDINGNVVFQTIDYDVGCVSDKQIRVLNGNIIFLSDMGWRAIVNGKIIPANLGEGAVDDIFSESGISFSINKQELENSFSVYYPELKSYMSWVTEGSDTTFEKCYNYHLDSEQFMPLKLKASAAAMGQDANDLQTVFLGDTDGFIYTYNIRNPSQDDGIETVSSDDFVLDQSLLDQGLLQEPVASAIPVFLFFNWIPNEDFTSSFNFRTLTFEAISDPNLADNLVDVSIFKNFDRATPEGFQYDFQSESGFTLDISVLDVDILSDERARIRVGADINISAKNILIGLRQKIIGAKLQLLASQLEFSRNGNDN